jgi:hypothetical protein
MLFLLIMLLTGILMFGFPTKYTQLVNWYFAKVGFPKRLSAERYSRWTYRASGLMVLLGATVALSWYVWMLTHSASR